MSRLKNNTWLISCLACLAGLACAEPELPSGDTVRRMDAFESQAPYSVSAASTVSGLGLSADHSSPRSWYTGLELVVSDTATEVGVQARHAVLGPADTADEDLFASIVPQWADCMPQQGEECYLTFSAPLTGYVSTDLRLTVPASLAQSITVEAGKDVDEIDAAPGDDPITASKIISLQGWRGSATVNSTAPIYVDLSLARAAPCLDTSGTPCEMGTPGCDCDSAFAVSLTSLHDVELVVPPDWTGRLTVETITEGCITLPEGYEPPANGGIVEFNPGGLGEFGHGGYLFGDCVSIAFAAD